MPAKNPLILTLNMQFEDGTPVPSKEEGKDGLFDATMFKEEGKDELGFKREGWEVRLRHSANAKQHGYRKMRFVVAPKDAAMRAEKPSLVARTMPFACVASTAPLRKPVAAAEAARDAAARGCARGAPCW